MFKNSIYTFLSFPRRRESTIFLKFSGSRIKCGMTGVGFTLMELLIVISIMSIITSIFLWDLASFRQGLAISRAAQDVAFAFRTAESRAMSIQTDAYANPYGFPSGYGLYFQKSDPQKYTLFLDKGTSPNGLYDPTTEHVATYVLPNYLRIHNLQIEPAGAKTSINDSLTVVYRRPFPTVEVRLNGSSTIVPNTSFGVIIRSLNGKFQKAVHIWTTGQIAVQ